MYPALLVLVIWRLDWRRDRPMLTELNSGLNVILLELLCDNKLKSKCLYSSKGLKIPEGEEAREKRGRDHKPGSPLREQNGHYLRSHIVARFLSKQKPSK